MDDLLNMLDKATCHNGKRQRINLMNNFVMDYLKTDGSMELASLALQTIRTADGDDVVIAGGAIMGVPCYVLSMAINDADKTLMPIAIVIDGQLNRHLDISNSWGSEGTDGFSYVVDQEGNREKVSRKHPSEMKKKARRPQE